MNKSKTVHPEVRIGHVHLKVADLERALAFYRDVLGFELTQRYGHQAAFLSAGGYHHHIGLNTWESQGGSPPHRGATGLYHVAIVYPTRAELADALRRLIKAGILKWTPKFGPRLKLDFSRTARCEKEQINETKTKTVQRSLQSQGRFGGVNGNQNDGANRPGA